MISVQMTAYQSPKQNIPIRRIWDIKDQADLTCPVCAFTRSCSHCDDGCDQDGGSLSGSLTDSAALVGGATKARKAHRNPAELAYVTTSAFHLFALLSPRGFYVVSVMQFQQSGRISY